MTDALGGKALRIARLSRHGDGKFLCVPMDHSVSDGAITEGDAFHELLAELVSGGADAVVVHKGRARSIRPEILSSCGLIVHLSASTVHASDADAKVLVGDVEEAMRLGADAVSVHINIGSATEAKQLADLGSVAAACDRWNLPLLAMAYARGPHMVDPHDPGVLAHVVTIASDLGADLVKTSWTTPLDRMSEVVAASPVPVLIAGGPGGGDGSGLAAHARAAMDAGCHGLAVGRRVFRHPAPATAVRELADIIHGRPTLDSVVEATSPSTRSLAGSL